MSRAPVEPPKNTEPAGFVYALGMEPTDWVTVLQLRDERVKQIIGILTEKTKSPDEKQIRREYTFKNYRLYRLVDKNLKLFVPKMTRWNLVGHFHDNMGHFATEKTRYRLKQLFWFPKMRKLVKEYVNACIACCYNKSQTAKPEGRLHGSGPEPVPFRLLHVDHLGPFVRSRKGNTYVLAFTDAFSKFCIIKAVRNTKTIPVLNELIEIISYFGLPAKLVTDRGTAFTSRAFRQFCEDNHISHTKTAVRTPRANGQVERTNATILNLLRTSKSDPKDWDQNLGRLQWAINSQPNATTNFTPNELIFNFKMNDAIHNHLIAAVSADISDNEPPAADDKRNVTLANITAERAKWKAYFDKKHAVPTLYAAGNLIVIKAEPPATGQSRKLEPKYRGPHIVAGVLGNDRYLIEGMPGNQVKSRKFSSVFSSGLMKPWCDGCSGLLSNDDNDNDSDVSDDSDNTDDDDNTDDNVERAIALGPFDGSNPDERTATNIWQP